MAQVLLPTLGSAGDVHPFIALGRELKGRGHRVTVMTNPLFAPLVERQGLGFLPVGSEAVARAAIGNPDVWHLVKGFGVISQVVVPAIEEIFRLIERHATADTVVAFSTLAFGARVAQEKLHIPSASIHLQPTVIRSYREQGMFGNVRLSPAHPYWFKWGLFRLLDFLVLDRNLVPALNQFRARLGLPRVRRIMHAWMHSPELVIGFFPEWFAPVQPDWPPNLHAVGFPLWDQDDSPQMAEARAFLRAGPAPVVFTPGSAGSTMQRFFAESVAAAGDLDLRAVLITNFPEQLPPGLPAAVRAFGYLPFSEVLPEAALLVYHGGIGTLAQGIHAGVPHLIVPHGYDQFDSGWRIRKLKLGRSIAQGQYRRATAARAIRELLMDLDLKQRCRHMAERVDGHAAVSRAADLIEALPARR